MFFPKGSHSHIPTPWRRPWPAMSWSYCGKVLLLISHLANLGSD
jgi:hypothetical protein